jgi:hypothetical protein
VLQANSLIVTQGGSVAASNFRGAARGGDVSVTAGQITLNHGGSVVATAGGGLAENLTVTTNFEESVDNMDLFLISPAGTQIQLSSSALDQFTYDDAAEDEGARPIGFLSSFIANDLVGD